MKKLKLFFACLLMAVLSIGQVWADSYTVTYTPTSSSAVSASGTAPTGSTAALTGNAGWQNPFLQLTYGKNAVLTLTGYKGCTITGFKMSMKSNSSKGKGSMTLVAGETTLHSVPDAAFNTNNWYGSWSTSAVDVDFTSVMTTDYTVDEDENIVITVTNHGTSNSTNSLYIGSYTITYEVSSSGGSTPSLSVSPTSWDFGEVAVSDEASKVFSVSGSNLTAGTLSISVPEGFSVSPSSISVTEATLAATNVTVSKNTNTIDDYSGNLSISGCGLEEAKNVALEMSVVADPEPTGTFELFSGDIEEGDYVIYYGGGAMNTTVTSNRLQYLSVTPAEDKIVNPDETIIWHIAASGDYWTLYNAAEEKYAASTSAKNQATMAAGDLTNNMKWSITGSATYEFENLARSTGTDSGNKWLRKNGTYGFACYSSTQSGTGPLTLYKKQVAGQPETPAFSIPGGNYETAQSVALSCETEGAKIYYTLDGSKPTSTSTEYSTAIPVSATTTIKAVAIKDNVESTVATATYTIVVWQTVADVWDDITADGPTNAHIYGYVSQIKVGGYDNNFYISDNGSTEGNQLYAYRMNMNSFSVTVGDKVKLAGDLTEYQGTKEFKYANSGATQGLVVALEAKGDLQSVTVSGTPTKTEYAANETFDPAGLKVYGTYANGFVGEIAEGITWGNDLTDGKVIESTTVHVTATVSEITSPAYDVPVTVAAKTLVSITLSYDAVEVYQGLELPKPTVTATYSEGDPEDVTAQAVFTGYDASTTGDQEITVTYTFGGHDETANYTVTVNPIFNVELAASVARNLIVNVVGNTESTDDMIVRGKVSYINNASSNAQTYWISDDGTRTNEVEIFKGKYLSGADFTSANQLRVGDEVVVIGKVINYSNSTPEFANGKSEVQSHVRTPNFSITDVASFEVGSADLAVADLTINVEGEGAVTFASSDNTDAVTIVDGKLHAVAAGTATITANLAANGIYKAATAEFNVTVIAATTKYAISFDGNGADGGSAPEAIADKAAGAEVTLPANSYTKTGYAFDGWKVYDENEDEVTVTAGVFEMPASDVTIKAQWTEIPVWAYTYTSNVTLTGAKVKFYGEETEYDAVKAGTGKVAGSVDITIPAQASKLHFHAYGWNDETVGLTVTAPAGVTVSPATEISINSNDGIASNSPFTLAEGSTPMTDAYYVVELSGNTEETTLTFTATSGKRFVLFGVNQEDGVLPVLDHIAITGTMTNTTGWKTGDNIVPEGLTVNAIYTLNNVEQTPVEVDPNDVVWSHAALTEGQTEVTLTATYTDGVEKTANTNVTIEAVETGDPEISTDVNSRSWTVNKGAAIPAAKTFAVTLKNIASATVTPGGDNPEAFNITPATLAANGNITVSVVSTATVGTYTATITIKDDASATSKVVNVSLTVENEEVPVSTTSEWVAATEITDGMEVLITGVKDAVTYAMGVQNKNNRAAVAGTLSEGVFTPGDNTMSFTLVDQLDGTFALQASNGNYLYAASSSDNYLKSRADIEDGNAKWTLTATSAAANGTNTNETLRFNTSSSLFSCYADETKQSDIKLYVPKPAQKYSVTYAANGGSGDAPAAVEYEEGETFTVAAADLFTAPAGKEFDKWNDGTNDYAPGATYTVGTADVVLTAYWKDAAPTPTADYTREVTIGNYGTICLPNGGTITNAKLYDLEYYDGASTLYLLEVNGNAMEAGKPYIFLPSATTIEVFYTDDANAPAGSFNGLVGSYTVEYITPDGSNYILLNNQYYRVVTAARVGANRAYIHMASVPTTPSQQQGAPRRRVAMAVNGENAATGFENIESGDKPMKVMIEGTMYILRGEKVYDATGRLVK